MMTYGGESSGMSKLLATETFDLCVVLGISTCFACLQLRAHSMGLSEGGVRKRISTLAVSMLTGRRAQEHVFFIVVVFFRARLRLDSLVFGV